MRSVLIIGGTGFIGKGLVKRILDDQIYPNVIVFSRDESKQLWMKKEFDYDERLNFQIGNVRDRKRLEEVTLGITDVIHTAALKQVPLCEKETFETVKTNVIGSQNVIDACIKNGVSKVLGISTDKAVEPISMYGATKLAMEKLFLSANERSNTRFSCVRFGNILGARDSVVELFRKQKKDKIFTITHPEITRFWLAKIECIKFVLRFLNILEGGEIFIPKVASAKVSTIAKVIIPDGIEKIIGLRPGERIHEHLLSGDESRFTFEFPEYYELTPRRSFGDGSSCLEEFEYNSLTNDIWWTEKDLEEEIG